MVNKSNYVLRIQQVLDGKALWVKVGLDLVNDLVAWLALTVQNHDFHKISGLLVVAQLDLFWLVKVVILLVLIGLLRLILNAAILFDSLVKF